MSWQNSYATPVSTTPAEVQYSSPPPYTPTTTAPPTGTYYPSNGFATITTTTYTVTATDIVGGYDDGGNAELSCTTSGSRPDHGTIIALGVVCGLQVIDVAILLFFLLLKRKKRGGYSSGEVAITPGFQSMGRYKRRHDQTEDSRGEADNITDYLSRGDRFEIPRKHRSHRRSHPVTSAEYDGVNRAGMNPAHWGNAGVQPSPTAYSEFPNPRAPVHFPPGQGNAHAVHVMQVPSAHPHRGRDEESPGEPSEVSSGSQEEVQEAGHRHPSVRRHHSKASSSARGRLGRH
jgi:hypothetical protein